MPSLISILTSGLLVLGAALAAPSAEPNYNPYMTVPCPFSIDVVYSKQNPGIPSAALSWSTIRSVSSNVNSGPINVGSNAPGQPLLWTLDNFHLKQFRGPQVNYLSRERRSGQLYLLPGLPDRNGRIYRQGNTQYDELRCRKEPGPKYGQKWLVCDVGYSSSGGALASCRPGPFVYQYKNEGSIRGNPSCNLIYLLTKPITDFGYCNVNW